MTGKVFARILRECLQEVVEDELPGSQCAWVQERQEMYGHALLAVPGNWWRKHTNTIPQRSFAQSIRLDPPTGQVEGTRKYGVPPVMVELLKSLHENMVAEVMVNGATTPQIQVNSGLRQGCTIAPTLLNLYFNLAVEQRRVKCRSEGVEVLYKCSGKLVAA